VPLDPQSGSIRQGLPCPVKRSGRPISDREVLDLLAGPKRGFQPPGLQASATPAVAAAVSVLDRDFLSGRLDGGPGSGFPAATGTKIREGQAVFLHQRPYLSNRVSALGFGSFLDLGLERVALGEQF